MDLLMFVAVVGGIVAAVFFIPAVRNKVFGAKDKIAEDIRDRSDDAK